MPLPAAKSSVFYSSSFFIFIIRFLPSLANLLVMVLYSRLLSAQQYGTYTQFWIQLYMLSAIACLGIHTLVVTYAPAQLRAIVATIRVSQYIAYFAWVAALAAVFAWLQAGSFSSAAYISVAFLFVFSAGIILESVLIVQKRFALLITVNLLYSVSFCYVHFKALQGPFSLTGLLSVVLLFTTIRTLIYFFSWFTLRTAIAGSPVAVGGLRSLWLHLGLYDVLQVVFSYIDKFVISLVVAAPISAVYYNGAQNIPFIPLMLAAAGSAVLIQVAGQANDASPAQLILLLRAKGRLLSAMVFPLFCFLFFFRAELFGWLFPAYPDSVPVFAVSICVIPLRAYSFTTVLQRMHKGNIIVAGAFIDLVLACALMYPFYLWLGLAGVALSFVVTTWLQAVFYLVYGSRILGVHWRTLVPLVHWGWKISVLIPVYLLFHSIATLYLNPLFTLFLGAALTVAIVLVLLVLEVKKKVIHGHIDSENPAEGYK